MYPLNGALKLLLGYIGSNLESLSFDTRLIYSSTSSLPQPLDEVSYLTAVAELSDTFPTISRIRSLEITVTKTTGPVIQKQLHFERICEVLSRIPSESTALRRLTVTLPHEQLLEVLEERRDLFRNIENTVLRLRLEYFAFSVPDVRANRSDECSEALKGACPLLSERNLLTIEFPTYGE